MYRVRFVVVIMYKILIVTFQGNGLRPPLLASHSFIGKSPVKGAGRAVRGGAVTHFPEHVTEILNLYSHTEILSGLYRYVAPSKPPYIRSAYIRAFLPDQSPLPLPLYTHSARGAHSLSHNLYAGLHTHIPGDGSPPYHPLPGRKFKSVPTRGR